MSVHLSTILRRTPTGSLRAYFDTISPENFADIDWTTKRNTLVDNLAQLINEIGDKARGRVYQDFDRVGQLMTDHGRGMLRAVLAAGGGDLSKFDAMEAATACAFHVLIHDSDAFEKALSAVFADRLLNGRDWTGLDFEPGGKPAMRPDPDVHGFTERLREIFASDGPVPRIHLERFSRQDPDPGGAGALEREQFTFYVEDAPESALVFPDGERSDLETRFFRRAREAALLFDATDRTLDVVVKGGGTARRQQIAAAFVEHMLKPGAKTAARPRRTLALDMLKVRQSFEVRPGDRVRTVEMVSLKLGAPDRGSIVTFETPARSTNPANGDFYERAGRVLGPRGPLSWQGWRVLAAKIRITFEPEASKKREKRVAVELKVPDRTNLRDQIELHRRIADQLLSRWGLYEGSA
ncbi:MAG: hypothetical protein RLO51_16255 [Thalassobaculum sp.]|uniref:hypothetical protein n=1 Tax=Thalassobaculum sp. TaxID=2022740 RepID=UPI0032EBB9A7